MKTPKFCAISLIDLLSCHNFPAAPTCHWISQQSLENPVIAFLKSKVSFILDLQVIWQSVSPVGKSDNSAEQVGGKEEGSN